MGLCFRGILFGGLEKKDGWTCDNGVNIDLNYRLHHSPDRGFIQNRTSYRLGFVRTGKIRHPRSRENQKQWDHEGYEANVTTVFYKHIHGANVSDSMIQYKTVELSGAKLESGLLNAINICLTIYRDVNIMRIHIYMR